MEVAYIRILIETKNLFLDYVCCPTELVGAKTPWERFLELEKRSSVDKNFMGHRVLSCRVHIKNGANYFHTRWYGLLSKTNDVWNNQ